MKLRYPPLILLLLSSLLIACLTCSRPAPSGEQPPEMTVKTDTVTLLDTVYVTTPQPSDIKPLGFIPVTLPVWRPPAESDTAHRRPEAGSEDTIETSPPDSATVILPVEQRHYAGPDYEAWVSGYRPALDSLRIYRPTRQITATTQITRRETRRWGLSVGAGMTLGPDGTPRPGIFIGATYTFFTF